MEKDLKIIAENAEINWADNWNFRSYLQHEIDPILIDETALAVYQTVTSEIDCTKCANCCRVMEPHLEEDDIANVASALDFPVEQTKNNYMIKASDQSYRFSKKPCPLLKDNKCSVYKSRPTDCSEFPHLNQDDFLGGSIGAIQNSRVCPIVYNVLEQLKTNFNYDPLVDYVGDSDPEAFNGSYWSKPVVDPM